MRVKSYGHIKPKEIKCTECGANLEYTLADVKKSYSMGVYKRDEVNDVVICPVCNQEIILDKYADYINEEDENDIL